MWDDALAEAVRNRANKNAAENGDGKTAYSYRGVNDDGIEVYETSAETKKLPYSERVKRYAEIMRNEYRGRTAKFMRNGHAYYALFSADDVRKDTYGDKRSDRRGQRAKINVGAEGNIFELVENAKYIGSRAEQGKKSDAHKNVKYWDYFVKQVQIDGRRYDVLANVRKRSDNSYVYSIQVTESKKTRGTAARESSSENGFDSQMGVVPSGKSIRTNGENVNTKSEKNSAREIIQPQEEHTGNLKPEDGSLSFSIRENENITSRTLKYYQNHRTQAAHISEEMLSAANDIVDEMAEYMKPFLDISNNKGKRYLPEEILGKTTFKNGSYGRTIENTTICFRTLAYIDFTNEIKERIGRPLTVEESFLASQMLYDIAKEPQCLYCYVSLDRKAYDQFMLEYIKQRDGVLKKYAALEDKSKANVDALYREFLDGRKATGQMRGRFDKWIRAAEGGERMLTAADLTTEEKRSAIKNGGGSLADQVAEAERYAQSASWAKKMEQYRSYNGDILSMSDRMVTVSYTHLTLPTTSRV